MIVINSNKGILFWILLFTTSYSALATSSNKTSCGGPSDLLLFVNRPSVADSACVVPDKSVVLELGYQYQVLIDEGIQQNFPQTQLRLGLADRFEFNVILPNYNHQTVHPYTGFNASAIGMKHEIEANETWILSIDGSVILPSGSASFGEKRVGGLFNGIFNYNVTSEISLLGMLGISTQTQSINDGGQRYSSINPYVDLSWSKEKISIYGEIYGQSKTGPENGSGFNLDTGVLYEVKKNIVIDLEVGQRLSGELFGFSRYIGTGIAIQFG